MNQLRILSVGEADSFPCGRVAGKLSASPTASDVTIVDPLSGDAWDNLLDHFPEATAFHTSAWARVLSRTYGHTPFYLKFTRAENVMGILPLMEVRSPLTGSRGVSLPFTDFCGPLVADHGVTKMIGEKLSELAAERRWRYIELRGIDPAIFPNACRSATFHAHTLSLDHSPTELWDRLESSVRRAVRKAGREGVTVEFASNGSGIREFYRLHSQTRRRHGLPPQPIRFFMNIYEEMIETGRGFLVQARASSKTIAAAIFFQFRDHAIYKFGASDETSQRSRPNNLVMWEAICRLVERGCRTLHFGRTEMENEGLRRFKLGWRTSENKIQYVRLGKGSPASTEPGLHTTSFHKIFFRMVPLSLNQLAGAAIYPHLD